MKNNFFKKIFILFSFILIVFLCILFVKKYIKHEMLQNKYIERLQDQVMQLRIAVEMQKSKSTGTNDISYIDDGYNYLAIGNSITIHEKTSYWWDEIEMAATDKNNDYVHIVTNYLSNKEKIKYYIYNFFTWEVMFNDRNESLSCIAPYMSDNLDLVTIQLSENVSNTNTYRSDFIDLIEYVKKNSPNAKIILIDDFWDNGYKSEVKRELCDIYNIDFVDLNDIKGDKEYQAKTGTKVYDADGVEHIITHSGVASHPGNKGMQYIADRIIDFIK